MKQGFLLFIMTISAVFSPFTFSQTGDSNPIDVFLGDERDRANSQTAYEMFQDYVNGLFMERQAFQQAFLEMSQFLKNIEDKKILSSDVNRMKKRVSEISTFLKENDSALSKKKDRIVKFLKRCMGTVSEAASSQLETVLDDGEEEESNQTPMEQFQDYVNDITSGREAFQRAISTMSDFLESINNNGFLRSNLNYAKREILKESAFLDESDSDSDEDDSDLFAKEDRIFEFLEQCVEPVPEVTPAQ